MLAAVGAGGDVVVSVDANQRHAKPHGEFPDVFFLALNAKLFAFSVIADAQIPEGELPLQFVVHAFDSFS